MCLDRLLMYWYVVKNVCQASLPSLTNGNILFRSMRNGNCLLNSASLSLVGDNSMVHERWAVELHLNATYAQHLSLQSIYEKSQYIMGGELFSSRTVFELAQGLWVSNKSDLNSLYEALVDRSIDHRVFASFLRVLSLSSVFKSEDLTSQSSNICNIKSPLYHAYFQEIALTVFKVVKLCLTWDFFCGFFCWTPRHGQTCPKK